MKIIKNVSDIFKLEKFKQKILSLDEIWWLVTPKNPLKILKPATYIERVNNCYKITKGTHIIIKEIENK